MTDYEIRDLNDQINKLLREKYHWENQIIALGGANYKRAAGKSTDADGREVPGQRGYKQVLNLVFALRNYLPPSRAPSRLYISHLNKVVLVTDGTTPLQVLWTSERITGSTRTLLDFSSERSRTRILQSDQSFIVRQCRPRILWRFRREGGRGKETVG